MQRCAWVGEEGIYREYHDLEWGVPLVEDQVFFEFLILEGAQAGLSWITVLKKRAWYRQVFDGFDCTRVARYGTAKIQALLADPGIIRNRLKVEAAVTNAQSFLAVQDEFGSFSQYVWRFVDGEPKINAWRAHQDVPTVTPESSALSRDLKQRGFKFVGPVIMYAFMQATGLVNDHTTDCFRYCELGGRGP